MALCTELSHPNLITLVEIILESKCIFMVFEYAEHDLLQIIHWHTTHPRTPIPATMLRSIMHQLLSGLLYLHRNWVLHRDLKPANIMITSSGCIKIGDLGLARLFHAPLAALFSGDKVVVTIWYRAPELLLGSRHYTPAIDLWAVGCIMGELVSQRPMFKGEEAKMEGKKLVPFQRGQMGRICEVLGIPKRDEWPLLSAMPEFGQLQGLAGSVPGASRPVGLEKWWDGVCRTSGYASANATAATAPPNREGLDLLRRLLTFDPLQRITAEQAQGHPYFSAASASAVPSSASASTPTSTSAVPAAGNGTHAAAEFANCFLNVPHTYPPRKVSAEDNDIRVLSATNSMPNTGAGIKRSALPDESLARGGALKRVKEG